MEETRDSNTCHSLAELKEAMDDGKEVHEMCIFFSNSQGAWHIVRTCLPRTPALKKLKLQTTNMNHRQLTQLAALLKHLPELRVLDLSENCITAKGIRALARQLHNLPALHTLALHGNNFGNHGIRALSHSLQHLHALRFLTLWKKDFTADDETLMLLTSELKRLDRLRMQPLDVNTWAKHAHTTAAETDLLRGNHQRAFDAFKRAFDRRKAPRWIAVEFLVAGNAFADAGRTDLAKRVLLAVEPELAIALHRRWPMLNPECNLRALETRCRRMRSDHVPSRLAVLLTKKIELNLFDHFAGCARRAIERRLPEKVGKTIADITTAMMTAALNKHSQP